MEDTLISFETAKLAKEKEFLEISNYPLWFHSNGVEASDFEDLWNVKKSEYFKHECILRPTQSLLQKWLREVHNIYVESYHDLTSDGTKIQFYTSWGFLQQKDKNGNRNVNGWYDEYNDWKTYEEALEFGLQEGLKLLSDEFY